MYFNINFEKKMKHETLFCIERKPEIIGPEEELITVSEFYTVVLNCSARRSESYSWSKLETCSDMPFLSAGKLKCLDSF